MRVLAASAGSKVKSNFAIVSREGNGKRFAVGVEQSVAEKVYDEALECSRIGGRSPRTLETNAVFAISQKGNDGGGEGGCRLGQPIDERQPCSARGGLFSVKRGKRLVAKMRDATQEGPDLRQPRYCKRCDFKNAASPLGPGDDQIADAALDGIFPGDGFGAR